MVRDARRRAPHHEGRKDLILRSIAKRCVSKDEANEVEIAREPGSDSIRIGQPLGELMIRQPRPNQLVESVRQFDIDFKRRHAFAAVHLHQNLVRIELDVA
jgi:hypothetical protein